MPFFLQEHLIPGAYKFDALITTFEMVLSDCPELREISWRCVIIDEAHRLKNRNCKLLDSLKMLDLVSGAVSDFRVNKTDISDILVFTTISSLFFHVLTLFVSHLLCYFFPTSKCLVVHNCFPLCFLSVIIFILFVFCCFYQEHKVLLTGTPLQNTVEELFSLLHFLEPAQFPSETEFLKDFGDLKTEEQV